jgi:predicted DNA repair protein MutK
MFLVGGSILSHGLPFVHHAVLAVSQGFMEGTGAAGVVLGPVVSLSLDALVGLAAGAVVLVLVSAVQKLLQLFKRPNAG